MLLPNLSLLGCCDFVDGHFMQQQTGTEEILTCLQSRIFNDIHKIR